ncbi:MAG: Uma2 family endonuclease [Quinella sp. 3Q1]|nr:Uma2 family endonuclease [Quinella sp. 3Q1]MBR6887134.1 Uma2 family endonuclease [Selenomonadaceae bacterium]
MATEIFIDTRDDYELIEGEKFMAPSADAWHNNAAGKLYLLIGMHAATNKLGLVFTDSLDVHFPDGNLFKPDFMFISAANSKIVIDNKHSTIHGVPDMVAEVFSRSTMKRDVSVKKDVYERNGVKEYWLIDPWSENIQVYLLRDGKYFLDDVYHNWSEAELNELTDEERAEIKFEVPVNVLDGFKVKIKNIFGWYFE